MARITGLILKSVILFPAFGKVQEINTIPDIIYKASSELKF